MVIFHSFFVCLPEGNCWMSHGFEPQPWSASCSCFTVGSVDVWQHGATHTLVRSFCNLVDCSHKSPTGSIATHDNNEFYPRIGWRLKGTFTDCTGNQSLRLEKTGFAARIFPWTHINCKPTINCMALKAWSLHLWTENRPQDFAFDMRDWPFEELEDLLRLSEEAGIGHQIGWSLRRPHSEGLSSFSLRTALFFFGGGWYINPMSAPQKKGGTSQTWCSIIIFPSKFA